MAELIDKLVVDAVNATKLYSTAVIRPFSPYPCSLKENEVGSGAFVTIAGKRGVLTNWHVAESFMKKQDSYVTVPHSEEKSKKLRFEYIVSLPPSSEESKLPDLAFIILKDSDSAEWDSIINDLGKQFFNFDEAKSGHDKKRAMNKEGLWIIHGCVTEGGRQINDRKTVYYKKSRPYVVVPHLEGIQKQKCYYNQLGCIEADVIDCFISVENKEMLPQNFQGMSGAALWNIAFNFNNSIKNIELVGLATLQGLEEDKLICQGPAVLYEFFYQHVEKMLI